VILVNNQRAGNILLSPIRAGVSLLAEVNIGYLVHSRTRNWISLQGRGCNRHFGQA
jgi:hypothetical protein